MTAANLAEAQCAGMWWLFDSTEPADHHEARQRCARCPVIDECRELLSVSYNATSQAGGGPTGTWAGKLLVDREERRTRKSHAREHGTERGYGQHRYAGETSCDECKAAHAARWRAMKAAS